MTQSKNIGMVLRSGKDLGAREKYKKDFLDHFNMHFEENDHIETHYSLGLTDPTLYEKMQVREIERDSDEDEEEYEEDKRRHREYILGRCVTEEQKNFARERWDLERCFDLAEVRNEFRGYLVDSFLGGFIDEEKLNYVVRRFGVSVDKIRFGLSIKEYKKLCREKLFDILFSAVRDKVISVRQFRDVAKRVNGLRGKGNSTFRRNKEEYFGVGEMIEETIEETTEKVETTYYYGSDYESDSETN